MELHVIPEISCISPPFARHAIKELINHHQATVVPRVLDVRQDAPHLRPDQLRPAPVFTVAVPSVNIRTLASLRA